MAGWLTPVLAGAAKYGPKVGGFAVKKLPWITGGIGALSQTDRGLGGMLQGGALGAATGFGLGGPLSGVMRPAAIRMAGLGSKLGLSGPALGAVAGATRAAIPIGAGIGLGALSGGGSGPATEVAGQTARGVGNVGAGATAAGGNWVLQNTITGEQVPLDAQSALPGGMGQFGYTDPYGGFFNQVNPLGPAQGRRTGKILDADITAKEINILAPTIRKWAEQAKKDEMVRQLAAAGVRQNIATNARLNELSAAASQQAATTGLAQTGSALTQQYNYA